MFPWNSFPFNIQPNSNQDEPLDESNIEDYWKKVLSTIFSNKNDNFPVAWLQPFMEQIQHSMANPFLQRKDSQQASDIQLFETFDFIIIRFFVPDASIVKNIKLYHTSNQVFIENFPKEGEKKRITLPALVQKKGSNATFKEGIIEMILIKKQDSHLTEIPVTEK